MEFESEIYIRFLIDGVCRNNKRLSKTTPFCRSILANQQRNRGYRLSHVMTGIKTCDENSRSRWYCSNGHLWLC